MAEVEKNVSPTVETIDRIADLDADEPRWSTIMTASVAADVGRLLESKSHNEALAEFHEVALSLEATVDKLRRGVLEVGMLEYIGDLDKRSYLLGAAAVLDSVMSSFEMARQARRIRQADEEDRRHIN